MLQLRELEDEVFSHRVVLDNGFEKIIPVELDPHMKGRAITLLEARTIIAALTRLQLSQVEVPPMFHPSHAAIPVERAVSIDSDGQKSDQLVKASSNPSSDAVDAAHSTAYLNEQFARAA